MIDSVIIEILSGSGGNGCISGRREKYIPHGGPDGGDGGDGGTIYVKASEDVRTLANFNYSRRFKAEDGGNGNGKKRHGGKGRDLDLNVPLGTVVTECTGVDKILADLKYDGEKVLVALGGVGGRGNVRFVSSTNRYPVLAEKGDIGEERTLRLEHKLISDVGIIGAPNAGKSSLLAAFTGADPKIADYPFTTLEPALGTVTMGYESFVMVDIPGLIEDAHKGAGLGHEFLRHIQRTKVMIHLIDGMQDDSYKEYLRIREEMLKFNERLGELPEIVAVNKLDLDGAQEKANRLQEKLPATKVHSISVIAKTGLGNLLTEVYKHLENSGSGHHQDTEDTSATIISPRPKEKPIYVREVNGTYVVNLRSAERVAAMVNPGDWHSTSQLKGYLRKMGVESALFKAGAQAGDNVRIGDLEMEWE